MIKILTILTFIIFVSDNIMAQKNNTHKAISRNTKKSINKNSRKNNNYNITKNNNKTETTLTQEFEINNENCDAYYTRCMNKICTDDTMGKCLCYEDKTLNNLNSNFININGRQLKQGFELFDYAKKQCLYILDQCNEQRRTISEKYKNLIQRDCLMITKNYHEQPKGLSGELKELKTCLRDACTSHTPQGYENYSLPEFSLCFSEIYAKFAIDAYCSNIISKSSQPLALKQLFLDEMALKREKSCIAMKGTLSNDRKKCYVKISYGINKEQIKNSKLFSVGTFLQCTADSFDAKKQETKETRQKKQNQLLSLTATGLNAAGTVLATGGSSDYIGKLVDLSVSATEMGADYVMQIQGIEDSNIPEAEKFENYAQMVVPLAENVNTYAQKTKFYTDKINKAKENNSSSTPPSTTKSSANEVLGYVSVGLETASQITDITMTNIADDKQMKEEKLGIIEHASIDRTSGTGQITETLTEKGNCYINNEWFASENENVVIMWRY